MMFLAGVYHPGGLLDGSRQRFFAQHVLPSSRGLDRQWSVFTLRRRNIDRVYLRICKAGGVLFVAVERRRFELVCETPCFFLVAADQGNESCFLAVGESRQDGALSNAAQTNDRKPDLLLRSHERENLCDASSFRDPPGLAVGFGWPYDPVSEVLQCFRELCGLRRQSHRRPSCCPGKADA